MAVNPTQEDYDIGALRTRNAKIKIELLNFNFQTISFFEGRTISGSISVDANSDIRRTCSLTMELLKTNTEFSQGGEMWIDKFIKIYEGVDNPRTNETVWWNMGIFLINNPQKVYDKTTNELSFEGLDLMAKLTGKRNGQLPAVTTKVPAGSLISNVVKSIITELGGFSNYVVEDVGYTIPYDIEKDVGSTIYDLLAEIRDLYSDWEMFFDVDGVFHWQQIPDGETKPIVLDFDQLTVPIVIKDELDINFEDVKNNIIVYGRLLDNGHQVIGGAFNKYIDSPFNIDKIGQINYIVNDERIYNDDLANQRARYELLLHSRMNDSINLDIVPLYWLNDVNIKIKYTNINNGIEGEFLLKTLSIPLGIGESMTLNAYKIYNETSSTVSINTNMTEWTYLNESAFDVVCDSSTFVNDVKINTTSGWEIVYLPIETIIGKQYTMSFNCNIITKYNANSGYGGIGYQVLNKVDSNNNLSNSIITQYLPTNITSQTFTVSFIATQTNTYFAFNFGMAQDNQKIEIKLNNFSLSYKN